MLNNVFLFFGEEKYLLQQELNRWIKGFVQKFGADSSFTFDSESFDLASIRQLIYSGGLFVNKKIIILYGLPSDLEPSNKIPGEAGLAFGEEFINKQGLISNDNVLVFVAYKPDKRTKFFKFLESNAGLKQFEPLKAIGLKNFVREKTVGLSWTEDVLDYFLAKIGSDLYHITNECEKLMIFSNIKNIKSVSISMIDFVNFGSIESNSFAFFDLLFENKDKCVKLVDDAQKEGVNWNLFSGTLYWGFKLWIYILDLDESGIKDSKIISSMLKAHPFVVSKALKNISNLKTNRKSIVSFYKSLVELDSDIKTGKLPDFYFWFKIKKLIIKLF